MFNSNASSADAGGANYIEDVFSTWLYTGTGVAQTITNGVDISGDGGMVWIKGRNQPEPSVVVDTARGASNALRTSSTAAQINDAGRVSAFTSSGFTVGTDGETNGSGTTYASWTFREQPKFFDVVTYTGTGSNRTIAHNLGSAPGCIIVKCTSTTGGWQVYHRSLTSAAYQLELNTTSAEFSDPTIWNSTAPTSTEFSVGTNLGINGSGRTYVAYLWAHNAGGFGLTGTDNVISCGSFTTGAYLSVTTVTLGYEPQWIMVKSTADENWWMVDNMRGMSVGSVDATLNPNLAAAESFDYNIVSPTATGFTTIAGSSLSTSATYIYIAIRRGPMAVPTLGTTVFSPVTSSASTGTTLTTNFPIDLQILKSREAVDNNYAVDRLRGVNTNGVTGTGGPFLVTNTTAANVSSTNLAITSGWNNTSFKMPGGFGTLSSVFWSFRRAPSFMDVVCYTGTGSAQTLTHNLGVAPTLMIIKGTNDTSANQWRVYDVFDGNDNYMALNTTAATASGYGDYWNSTTPTSSAFYVGTSNSTNAGTYVAYLFATCVGVSKVGSYTGTAAAQTINCGFTAGARFVLIKRTDSTGDWYVWDSARGIIAGDDPYLLLNSTAAEVTNTDYVDTAATGFELSSTAPAAINANGGTYLFLAIA